VLSVAAVMGRDFRLDVLQRVLGLPEEEVYAALEEATDRAVVEQRQVLGAIAFRFTHAFFRQTLYEEIFAPRRIRIHQQVGRALEAVHARRIDEHAAELAEHFAQSTEAPDLEKALHYSELAAQRAMSVFAYSQAERHLQQALRTLEELNPDDRAKRCQLLLALGEAMLPLEDPQRVADTVAREAFTLAEGQGDNARAARAAVQAMESMVRSIAGPYAMDVFQEWAERADLHALQGTRDRVYADIYQGLSTIGRGRPAAAHVHLRRAVETARILKDDQAFFAAAGWSLRRLRALRDLPFVNDLANEAVERPREGVRGADVLICLQYAGLALFDIGERGKAFAAWRLQKELADRLQDASFSSWALGVAVFEAYIEGRLEEAATLLIRYRARCEELNIALLGNDVLAAPLQARLLYLLGRPFDDLLPLVEIPLRPVQMQRAHLLAFAGRRAEALEIASRFENVGDPADETGRNILESFLEIGVLLGEKDPVAALLPRLGPNADMLLGLEGTSLGRLCGGGAALLNRPQEARRYYDIALEACKKVDFRPEAALVRLEMAELLLDHYPDERVVAIDHLDSAIAEFREMKMQPSLERALRHRELLKA
jgi:hypothetical protein